MSTKHRATQLLSTLALVIAAISLGACSSPRADVAFDFDAADYGTVLSASRDALRDFRFEVDRLDAEAGIITTAPKPSSGLATPWDADQSSLGLEVSDLLNQQQRAVTITFESPDNPDLRFAQGPISARVDVVIYRVRTSGWRLETESISQSRYSRDPLARSRGAEPRFLQPWKRDDALAQRLSAAIRERIEQRQSAMIEVRQPEPPAETP